MVAEPVHREKRIVINPTTGGLAIAEIKVWKVSRSKEYPEGRKFSLFLVLNGMVVIGIDNHKPKGPHLHLGETEVPYRFVSDEKLLEDFWELVRKAGFEP